MTLAPPENAIITHGFYDSRVIWPTWLLSAECVLRLRVNKRCYPNWEPIVGEVVALGTDNLVSQYDQWAADTTRIGFGVALSGFEGCDWIYVLISGVIWLPGWTERTPEPQQNGSEHIMKRIHFVGGTL